MVEVLVLATVVVVVAVVVVDHNLLDQLNQESLLWGLPSPRGVRSHSIHATVR